MSELLQEYVDSGSQRLRVDRTAGVIRGVKLLGLSSRNGLRVLVGGREEDGRIPGFPLLPEELGRLERKGSSS